MFGAGLWIVMIAPIVAYAAAAAGQPSRSTVRAGPIWSDGIGLDYRRMVFDEPRPQILHVVTIDLASVDVVGTEPIPNGELAADRSNPPETLAETTRNFALRHEVDVAINANFFSPFEEFSPWDYEPRSGDEVGLIGLAVTDSVRISDGWPERPALCLSTGRASVRPAGGCEGEATTAVSGKTMLVSNGLVTDDASSDRRAYPQTVVAVDERRERLWLLVVDGKQPLYAEGMTLGEIALAAVGLGAHDAIRLDGGGSATLVARIDDAVEVLNAPIHTKWPGQERPVGNNLGFRRRP